MTDRLLADLALARGPLRRDDDWRDRPDWFGDALAAEAWAIDVDGEHLGVQDAGLAWRPITSADADRAALLGVGSDGLPRLAVIGATERKGRSLRLIGADLPDEDAALATTAVALAQWHATHLCCPRCGAVTRVVKAGWARACEADGSEHFPRTDPAVIVLVRDPDDRALLGRRGNWPESWFSTLAGFVEAGESAEHTLRREVAEEAGVVVDPQRLVYRGSQPWPFPGSLMLGFHAWASAGDDPTPDCDEIAEARWLSRDDLAAAASAGEVRIPPRVSIARHLIEDWFGGELPGDWSRP